MEFFCFVCTLLFLAFWFFGEKFLLVLGGNFFLAFFTITIITLFCSLVSMFAWEWIRARRRFCLLIALGAFSLSMAACSKPYPVYETEIVTMAPPAYLLEPFQVPSFTGDTNEDLLLYTLNMRQNLQLCNARLEAVRKSVTEDIKKE